jgi:signal transduction histidine kinase
MAAPRLKTRLFIWFLAAIVLAAVSSSLSVVLTRPDGDAQGTPRQVVARTMSGRLSRMWDDRAACEAYVAEMREVTGFDFRLLRDPDAFPRSVQRAGRRANGVLTFDPDEGAFIPIAKDGALVGAVQFDASGAHRPWWRLVAALGVGGIVLAIAAQRVSKDLARPLEVVAEAADRFGRGDLGARAKIDPARGGSAEVQQVAHAFDTMANRVEVTVRDQRELLGAISHEIRSPLGRARVALEIARERAAADARVGAPLDDLERQLADVDAILEDLLAVARAGLTDLHRAPTPLLPWLRRRLAAEGGEVELVATAEDAAISVAIDGALLGRALHNLLGNARAHGHPEDIPLAVHVIDRGQAVRVEVRDEGPGFAEELLPRVFEPFVRGDASRAHGAGTGLGLALVRRIVEAHGGSSFALNREDQRGAVTGFELPVLERPATDLSRGPAGL